MSGGRFVVKVDGDSSGFKHAMDSVRTQAKGVADEIGHSWTSGALTSFGAGIIGAFSFEAVKSSLESFLGRAKDVKDLSEQFDMSTQAVQKWGKAADKAGLSASAAFNVISAIQSKRQEALRDPKASDLFQVLGISRDQVLHQDNSQFAKDVLTAGGKDEQSRALLEQIVGRRGLKVAAAAKDYDTATPDISPEAIEQAHEAEQLQRKIGNETDNAWSDLFGFLQFGYRLIKWSKKDWQRDAMQHGAKLGKYADPELLAEQWAKETAAKAANPEPKKQTEDPLIGIQNQQEKEYDLQQHEAEMGLHAAERRNMTISGRKKSIKTDMAALAEEIKARTTAADLRLVYGMTQKQTGDLLPTDREKQLREDYIKLIGLKGKQSGLTGELRQGTNFNMSADSLARVGLFSSSTLSVNPMLQLSQQQVKFLEKIEHNTSHHPENPHRR